VPLLPSNLEKIGVFVDAHLTRSNRPSASPDSRGAVASDVGPDVPAQLRRSFGPAFRILRVIHFGHTAQEQVAAIVQDANVDAILVDSRTATAVAARHCIRLQRGAHTVFQYADLRQGRLVVAGGLTPPMLPRPSQR